MWKWFVCILLLGFVLDDKIKCSCTCLSNSCIHELDKNAIKLSIKSKLYGENLGGGVESFEKYILSKILFKGVLL